MNESAREPAVNDEPQVSSEDTAQENQSQAASGEASPSSEAPAAHADNVPAGDIPVDNNPAEGAPADEAPAGGVSADASEVDSPVAGDDIDVAEGEDDIDDDFEEQYSGDEDAKPIEMIEDYDGDENAQPVALGEEGDEIDGEMKWYILKVQSNREDSIRDALVRRMKIAGLESYVDRVIVPKRSITEYKGGRQRVRKEKVYPGYIVVHMVINEETWFLVRETPGIGDFTGAAGKPTPMLSSEVERILDLDRPAGEKPKKDLDVAYSVGERVKVTEGNFLNMEGDVEAVDAANQRVTVLIQIFGRPTPVELEYWQVQQIE